MQSESDTAQQQRRCGAADGRRRQPPSPAPPLQSSMTPKTATTDGGHSPPPLEEKRRRCCRPPIPFAHCSASAGSASAGDPWLREGETKSETSGDLICAVRRKTGRRIALLRAANSAVVVGPTFAGVVGDSGQLPDAQRCLPRPLQPVPSAKRLSQLSSQRRRGIRRKEHKDRTFPLVLIPFITHR